MRPLPYLLAFLLSFGSCTSIEVGPPPVDLDYFAPLTADIHLAEALTNEVPAAVRDSMRDVFYDNVLADHGTDRATFEEQMWQFRQEPVWIDSLYTRVGEILARRAAASEL